MAENTLILLDPPKEKKMASSSDEIPKKTVCILPVSDYLNLKSPLGPCHFRENERLSVSFQDFGRESLGILPPDFGKDTLSFLNMSLSDNRELCFKSILNISDYGRESLESGRESLGILQINKLDVRLGYEDEIIPEIMLTTISERNEQVENILDTAFLFPSPRKTLLSSTSSQNSGFPSFNSCSLEEPSKIYSLSRNEAASGISSNLELYSAPSDLNNAKIISPSEIETQHTGTKESFSSPRKIFWSTGKAIKCKSWLRRSFHGGKLDFKEERENILHDSIVIEGNHIAQKIADGSILNNGCGTHILDNTPQPSWPSDLDESKTKEKDSPKFEYETKSKTIDEIFSEPQENVDLQLKTSRVDSTPSKSKDAREILQNLSEILNSTHRSDQQRSQGQNLLSSLAEILCEGSENYPSHLDDSGHSSFIEQNDSSDKDKNDHYEVLDLSKKSVDSKDSKSYEYISNISVNKVAKTIIERRLSQSFCSTTPSIKQMNWTGGSKKRNSSTSGLESSKNITSNSNSSVKSNDSQGSGSYLITNINSRFKTKPSTGGTKKGPLRAVIPVKDMKRKSFNNAQTPDKSQQRCSTSLQSKRTSTPINEPKLKPMAASTPTTRQLKDPKDNSESNAKIPRIGPSNEKNLPRSDKVSAIQANSSKEPIKIRASLNSKNSSTDKTNNSGSSLRERVPLRRNSASEIKIDDIRKLKRSNSLGKETGLMSSLGKIRENLLKSSYFDSKKKGVLTEANNNNGCAILENTKYSVSKHMNLLPKVKTGKENVK